MFVVGDVGEGGATLAGRQDPGGHTVRGVRREAGFGGAALRLRDNVRGRTAATEYYENQQGRTHAITSILASLELIDERELARQRFDDGRPRIAFGGLSAGRAHRGARRGIVDDGA